MGERVKILEPARHMIRLSGKEPETDIPISFVGARPGEKLHEELWTETEAVAGTTHPKIMRTSRPPVDAAWLDGKLRELERLPPGRGTPRGGPQPREPVRRAERGEGRQADR